MQTLTPETERRIENLKLSTGPYGVAFSVRPLKDDDGDVFEIAVTLVSDNEGHEIAGSPEKLPELFRAIAGRIEAIWGVRGGSLGEGFERNSYLIRKNDDRYDGIDPNMPQQFSVVGLTLDQAEWTAEHISNHNAGCDYSWYVVVGGTADKG
jgi:hypothetical protein